MLASCLPLVCSGLPRTSAFGWEREWDSPALEKVYLCGCMGVLEARETQLHRGEVGLARGGSPRALSEQSTLFPDWCVQARVWTCSRLPQQLGSQDRLGPSQRDILALPSHSQKACSSDSGLHLQMRLCTEVWMGQEENICHMTLNKPLFPMSSFNTSRAPLDEPGLGLLGESRPRARPGNPDPFRSQLSTPPTFL